MVDRAQTCVLRARPPDRADRGFTLIELGIVLVVFGLLLAITVPGYHSYVMTQRLRGSAEDLAALVRLTRARAMTTGVDQPIHFYANTYNADFHVHVGTTISYPWSFPPGVHYAGGSTLAITMAKDGSASPAGLVILRDDNGDQDTLSVLSSGIVLIR